MRGLGREEIHFNTSNHVVVHNLFYVPTFVYPDVATSAFIFLNQYHYHSESSYHQTHQQKHLFTFLDFTTSTASSRAGKFLSFARNWQQALAELPAFLPLSAAHKLAKAFLLFGSKQSDLAILSSLKQHHGVFRSPVADHGFRNHDHLQNTGKRCWWDHVHYWGLWSLWQHCQGKKFQTRSWPDPPLRSNWLTKDIISFSPSASATTISGRRLRLSASIITCVDLPTNFQLLPSSQPTSAQACNSC